jgi:cell division protein FtsW (lipid II flippase)
MIIGICLAFSAVYFWSKNKNNDNYFLIVLAALFNYLYSFFRVLENVELIPHDWFMSIYNIPIIKILIILLTMLFLLIGILKLSIKNDDKLN